MHLSMAQAVLCFWDDACVPADVVGDGLRRDIDEEARETLTIIFPVAP